MIKKKAFELKVGDVVLYKQKPFLIDYIEEDFSNDKVAKKYGETDKVSPEDTIYTFGEEFWKNGRLFVKEIEKVNHARDFYFIGKYQYEDDFKPLGDRAISKKLRFQILFRDGFKCVKCGRGAIDGVKLHVDHIKPFSVGGNTVEENLQTLCDDCNIGKGNKGIV